MNMQLKERLVGGLVLIGLLVIWLPFFLGGDDTKTTSPMAKKSVETKKNTELLASNSNNTAVELPLEIKTLKKPVQLTDTKSNAGRNTPIVMSKSTTEPVTNTKTYETALMAPLSAPTVDPDIATTENVVSPVIKKPILQNKPVKKPESVVVSTSPQFQKWGVQVANISQPQNVQALVKKLNQNGFKVSQQTVRLPSGNRVTQIWVAAGSKKEQATQVAIRLQKRLNLKGKVMAYGKASNGSV